MADRSKIEWTNASWNPIRARNLATGKIGWHCIHASEGCRNCYAEVMNRRLGTRLDYKPGNREGINIFLDEKLLLQPLHWRRPRKIFLGSMTDIFADFVTNEMLDKIFAVMALCPQHTFQVLTKRPARMRKFLTVRNGMGNAAVCRAINQIPARLGNRHGALEMPLPNLWLGVTAEDQQTADARIPDLLATPAAVRFISAEPLLGPIDLTPRADELYQKLSEWYGPDGFDPTGSQPRSERREGYFPRINWLICGGESGSHARPMHPDWARSLRDQCAGAGVPFFFKQWGEYLPVSQILPGYGKVHGATAVKPGRMKLHYGGTPTKPPQHVFAKRGVHFASTADGRLTFRVGKKAAGHLLDGIEHDAFPEVR